MANNYFDLTGVLILDKVTPVIEALFGPFKLDADYPGNGQAYIADIAEDNNTSWHAVADGLRELMRQLGLSLPEDAAHDVERHLRVLAAHFGGGGNATLDALIEQIAFADNANLDALFAIARCFDDGHGLKAFKTEASWRCDKPCLFEFGGSGEFCGRHLQVHQSTDQVVSLGEDLEAALDAGDYGLAAERIRKTVDKVLAGFTDDSARQTVRARLADLLGASQQLSDNPA